VADVLPLRPGAVDTTANSTASPLVVDAKALAKLLGLGVRTIRTHDAAGKLPSPIRIGGRVVWVVAEIRDWLTAGAPDRKTWEARRAARK